MNRTSYPEIQIYRYHFMAMLASGTDAQLSAVGESIRATVPAGHAELPILVAAGQQRRQEINYK